VGAALPALAALVACGGSPSAPSAPAASNRSVPPLFENVHAAACSGDVGAFFTDYVDESRLITNMGRPVTGAPGTRRISTGSWGRFSPAGRRWLAKEACEWTFVASEVIGDEQRIEVRSGKGKKALLYFASVGGSLKLIDLDDGNGPKPLDASTSMPPSPGASTDGEPIGVEACDAYVAKWKDCYREPAAQEKERPGFDRMTSQWKQIARDPGNRAALNAGCGMALDLLTSICSKRAPGT
jgi:hypothetical protein